MSASSSYNQTRATLALLLRLTSSGVPLGWEDVGCAALLAVRHVQQRDGSVVPSLVNVPAGFNLSTLIYDSESTPTASMTAYLDAKAKGAHAVLGPARSASSTPVAMVGGVQVCQPSLVCARRALYKFACSDDHRSTVLSPPRVSRGRQPPSSPTGPRARRSPTPGSTRHSLARFPPMRPVQPS
jgi:hypothetical protein